MNKTVKILITFIVLLIIVIGYFVFYNPEKSIEALDNKTTEMSEYDGWLTFDQKNLGFAFNYPTSASGFSFTTECNNENLQLGTCLYGARLSSAQTSIIFEIEDVSYERKQIDAQESNLKEFTERVLANKIANKSPNLKYVFGNVSETGIDEEKAFQFSIEEQWGDPNSIYSGVYWYTYVEYNGTTLLIKTKDIESDIPEKIVRSIDFY